MNRSIERLLPRQRAQSMVEFAIALPVLLLLIFGIIEFGRMLQAWMAVQNAARFGLRYLVTGEYDPVYCHDAAAGIGTWSRRCTDGDRLTTVPSRILTISPQAEMAIYGAEATRQRPEQRTDRLGAHAFRRGIRRWSAAPVWRSTRQSREDYLAYLSANAPFDIANLPAELGSTTVVHYIHTTICSSRDRDLNGVGDFGWEENTFPELCKDTINDTFMDDAGGPGDRVRIMVTFNFEPVVPFISTWWPVVPLTAWREGIVERFRTSRISGIGSQIIVVPTDSNTPTKTNTPTNTAPRRIPPPPHDTPTRYADYHRHTPTRTSTGTQTPTNTPTVTNTPSNTPTVTRHAHRRPTRPPLPTHPPRRARLLKRAPPPTPASLPIRLRSPGRAAPTRTRTPTRTRHRTRRLTDQHPTADQHADPDQHSPPTNTPTKTGTFTNTPTRTNTPIRATNTSRRPTTTNTVPPTNTPTRTSHTGPADYAYPDQLPLRCRRPSRLPGPTRRPLPTRPSRRAPLRLPIHPRRLHVTSTPTPSRTPCLTPPDLGGCH